MPDDRDKDREREERRKATEDMLKERGLYYLPDVPEEPERADEGPPEFDWRDVLAFIIASYQIIFPFLGVVLLVFLALWGVLWLIS